MVWESNFKTFTCFLMQVTITTDSASLHSKREALNCEGKGNSLEDMGVNSLSLLSVFVLFLFFVYMFIEGTGILCNRFSPCHGSVVDIFHIC